MVNAALAVNAPPDRAQIAVASQALSWQEARMNNDRNAMGGGIAIAVGAIGGAVGGLYAGQPSLGLILGVAAGVVVALIVWLAGRR
jgi:hypothetical protein